MSTGRMSSYQESYLEYIQENPGCSIADVVRSCRVNPRAGHRWIYDGVHRLARRGYVCIEYKSNRTRTKLYVGEK